MYRYIYKHNEILHGRRILKDKSCLSSTHYYYVITTGRAMHKTGEIHIRPRRSRRCITMQRSFPCARMRQHVYDGETRGFNYQRSLLLHVHVNEKK